MARCLGNRWCDCRRCVNRRNRIESARNNERAGEIGGQEAVIDQGNTGRTERLDVYYGGEGSPGGPGHGHVVSNDGENVNYWREPGQSTPSIDDRSDNPYGD